MGDLEFVQRCISGDKLALDEFVDKYSRLIYKYIHSVLNTNSKKQFSQDNINDLFQDFFLLLAEDNFKKLRSFQGKNGCSLATWLKQVVVNYTIDYLRKFKPAVSLDEENDEGLSLKDVLADGSTPISDTLAAQDDLAHLKDCIKRLDIDDKYFLELYLNQGLTLEELRRVFKISRPAADMRKTRLIERLRECFKHRGFLLDF
ncbi:MAG: sigma-70 family RNA polymerase sigma factor [Candidatus Omnitrophota bacterium]|jgi:RNA polymerase sigma-70 factor (ECF subfamily)